MERMTNMENRCMKGIKDIRNQYLSLMFGRRATTCVISGRE